MHLEVNWNSIELNWIEIHCLEIELNSNSTKFNSKIILKWNWIEFKFIWKENGMQNGGKDIENLLVNMVLREN
jgi:hypothetical protein